MRVTIIRASSGFHTFMYDVIHHTIWIHTICNLTEDVCNIWSDNIIDMNLYIGLNV